MKRSIYVFVCLVMLVSLGRFAAAPAVSPAHAQSSATFEAAPCPVEVPDGLVEGKDIKCGYLTVPEEHANPGGPTIQLAVAVLPSTSANPAPDPLFMNQGGPGGSTLDYFVQAMNGALGEQIRETRDIVLMEQRGTLYSEPALVCTELTQGKGSEIQQDLTVDQERTLERSEMAACRKRLTNEGINLSAFDSVENAADVNDLRVALGYDQINFYGVSYGTMLGQHYMRDFPETLRSVILDGVVPLALNYIPQIPSTGQRVFDLMFQTCAADPGCSAAYPNLESEFYETVQNLNANPATVSMTDPTTLKTYDAVLTGDRYVYLIFYLFYVTPILPQIPSIIHDAYNGTFDTLGYIAPYLIFDYTMADAMYYATICAEDADMNANEADTTGINPAIVPALDFVQSTIADCAMWNVQPLGSYVDNPIVTDIPTLLLSGEFDPITPPRFAAMVAENIKGSYSYTVPAVGHGSFDDPCGFEIATQFLNDPTNEPDLSCLADEKLVFSETAPGETVSDAYSDAAGNFTVAGPVGWENQSTSMAGVFIDGQSGSVIAVASMPGIAPQTAIEETLASIAPGFSDDPIDTLNMEMPNATWTGSVYQLDQGVQAVALTTQHGSVTFLIFGAANDGSYDALIGGVNEIVANWTFLK